MFTSSLNHSACGLIVILTLGLAVSIPNANAVNAEENQQINGLVREPLMLPVTLPEGKPALLEAFVTRPAGDKRWPVALITHGTAETAEFDRLEMNPNWMSGMALAFARHGYAAVVVMREGYGYSSGGAEYTGSTCVEPRHDLAGKRDAEDLLGALNAIRHEPWASHHSAILAGMSAGGFGVLATGARQPKGVQAIINFDGGRGAGKGGSLCDRAGLLKSFASMGATSRIPSLWLYSQNDTLFPPFTGISFFHSYTSAGGLASFIVMPPYDTNGHTFIESAPEDFWWHPVAEFLQKQRLAYKAIVATRIERLPLPQTLNSASGTLAFRKYESAQLYEKAFATDVRGVWGVSYRARTTEDAAARALSNCQMHEHTANVKCRIYAVNNTLMP